MVPVIAEPMCPLDDTLPAAWCSHCKGLLEEPPRTRGDSARLPVDDDEIRTFSLNLYADGARIPWEVYLDALVGRWGDAMTRAQLMSKWNRVSNQLGREGLLVNDPALPDGIMRPSDELPHVRWLSVEDTIAEIVKLIENGGWVSGEKGLKDWGVAQRLRTVQYPCVHDALHAMNKRGYRVHTRSIFWYVNPESGREISV